MAITGHEVPISKSVGQSVAFSAFGILLKQREVVEVTEYRGYADDDTAKDEADEMFADSSAITTLYHATTGGGFVMASVLTGTMTTAVAHRANEANMWVVTKTKTTYSYNAPTGSAWTTTRPAAGDGFVTGISRSVKVLTEVQGNALRATESASTKEWRGCTAAEASSLVANCPSDSLTNHTYRCVRIATEIGRFEAQSGTRYSMDSRFVSDAEGYNVTMTTTTVSVSGDNWTLVS